MVSFSTEETRRSKRARVCQSCETAIAAGDIYTRWAGLTDGSFSSCAFHPDCRALEVELNHELGPWGDDWVSLHEWYAEDRTVLNGAPQSIRARFGLAPFVVAEPKPDAFQFPITGPLRAAVLSIPAASPSTVRGGFLSAIKSACSLFSSVGETTNGASECSNQGKMLTGKST